MFSVILSVMDEGSDEGPRECLEASRSDDALTTGGFIRVLTRPPQWAVCSSMKGSQACDCGLCFTVHTEPGSSLIGIKAQTFEGNKTKM